MEVRALKDKFNEGVAPLANLSGNSGDVTRDEFNQLVDVVGEIIHYIQNWDEAQIKAMRRNQRLG